jgi:hypothetical protein
MGALKTTVEIPDSLFRQAKALAARQGITLKDFMTQAVRERLQQDARKPVTEKPWMRGFGALRDLGAEHRRVEGIIEESFERIDDEEWR